MLIEQVKKDLIPLVENKGQEEVLFQVEIDYLQKHELLSADEANLKVTNSLSRFREAYIERSNKETDESLGVEESSFLNESISYLRHHKAEFIYIESKWFEMIGVDSLSLEVDDVFGTYDVMLGLKLKKKAENNIKEYLNQHHSEKEYKFNLMFNQQDGLWDLNFPLDLVENVTESSSIGDVLATIYQFLFKLVEFVEEK
ncbi:branched-chain amino acid aminotransferase [Metabacillus litoralis]|uniref:branched-chain amino acid aminotransferase n=1 Tax=Metabacillus litoralis TaxID=152268 RepID=UPI001CFC8524|nr:branched-chain amino acid aminotransferase [Metabacillus litoralis]